MSKKKPCWKAYFRPDTGSMFDWDGDINKDGTYWPDWRRDADGNQILVKAIEMDPEQIYYGLLKFDGYFRGRSAAGIQLKNADPKKAPEQVFCMRISELCNMLEKCEFNISQGMVSGYFRVVKQGANYSLSFVAASMTIDEVKELKCGKVLNFEEILHAGIS